MGGSVVTREERPLPARIALFAAGQTVTGFAAFHHCTVDWASRVLTGRAAAPERFRQDLSRFLGLPVAELFPDEVPS